MLPLNKLRSSRNSVNCGHCPGPIEGIVPVKRFPANRNTRNESELFPPHSGRRPDNWLSLILTVCKAEKDEEENSVKGRGPSK
mmetsp:Transcript_25060/g.41081  ORF Transcript_25060/g.41081 Transcript_25060/m.41081 type:complete len:83 (+) Transcript_25060:248-496(+)